jgi:hypothetical protein
MAEVNPMSSSYLSSRSVWELELPFPVLQAGKPVIAHQKFCETGEVRRDAGRIGARGPTV